MAENSSSSNLDRAVEAMQTIIQEKTRIENNRKRKNNNHIMVEEMHKK